MSFSQRAGLFFKNHSLSLLFEFVLWVLSVAAIGWLWNRWTLDGPYGPYRWVGMDFAPFWVGVREMFHGANPYAADTTLKIQQVVYGGPAAGNDPMMFVYPAWMFVLIAPFSLLPFQWAAILYIGTLLWAMLNLLYLISWNLSKRNFISHTLWMTWLTLGALPFLAISVIKGQLGYIGLIALFITRRIWNQRPQLAGIILALALIKPTVTVIPVAGFLVWALLEKDLKFISGFLGSLGFLFITSLVAVGNWIPGYLAMLNITGGMPVMWSMAVLYNPWNLIYLTFFITLGGCAFFIARRENNRDLWLSVTFLAGIALVPMRWIYDLYLGILIPAEGINFSRIQTSFLLLATVTPWSLVFIREADRWNAAVVGWPLIWALCYLFLFIIPRFFGGSAAGELSPDQV